MAQYERENTHWKREAKAALERSRECSGGGVGLQGLSAYFTALFKPIAPPTRAANARQRPPATPPAAHFMRMLAAETAHTA